MARYKLTLAYDGSDFSGSQRQAGRRTVQAELERALRMVGWSGSSVALAGRTDAGVHAAGQVAAVDLDWGHGEDRLRDALNSNLAADVVVAGIEVASGGFHPRFDAASRRYQYRVYCQATRDPLRDRMAWRVWPPVTFDTLSRAAHVFLGRHDFGAFGSAPRKDGGTTRTVTTSRWTGSDAEWKFEVAANGFLYRMVRRMVFVQIAVAQARCDEGSVVLALASGKRPPDLPAGLAPPGGLTLVGVDY
jgi:tRNA pseudouridine38-40 synthase